MVVEGPFPTPNIPEQAWLTKALLQDATFETQL